MNANSTSKHSEFRYVSSNPLLCKTFILVVNSKELSCDCGPGSVAGIATGYGLDGPGIESRWRRVFPPVQTGPGAHSTSCKMGTGSFPGVKCCLGVTLTPHPLLLPWSRKITATPLLPLCAVRPVQSLRTCTSVLFTFIFPYTFRID